MAESAIIEKCLSLAVDKGLVFTSIFVFAGGALLNMSEIFGYPLDGPHKAVLFALLLFVCAYGHYSLKAIKLWILLKTPKTYSTYTKVKMNELRDLVEDIAGGIHSGVVADLQLWDTRLRKYNEFCIDVECSEELEPIVTATRHIMTYKGNNISNDRLEAAYMMFYEGKAVREFMNKTKWALT